MMRRGGRGPAPVEQRTQINFEDAVTTLQTMFDTIDRDVIRMILQANQGQMEATVENLLQMCAPGGFTDDTSSANPASNQNDAEFKSAADVQSVNLPEDFLRPPSWFRRKYPQPLSDEETAREIERRQIEQQKLDDEILAKVMQNSMFLSDLQAHPEWVTEAESGPAAAPSKAPQGPTSIAGPDPTDTTARKANFREKMGALSAGARAKLGALAQRLSRNKDKSASGAGGGGLRRGGTHNYQQITSLDDEPLLDDDDDDVDRPFNNGIELQARGGYKPPNATDDL